MLHGFQLLQANLNVKGTNELWNIMYNMVRQQNSQDVEEMLICLGENPHNMNPRGNMVQEVSSQRSRMVVSKSLTSCRSVALRSLNHQRSKRNQTLHLSLEGG